MTQLYSLRLAGWKSIRDATILFRPLNVLIGANGAGKSNLVSFFKLMNEMMVGRLQFQVGTTGGGESLLHYGSKRTPYIEAKFPFIPESGKLYYYYVCLVPAADNSLLFKQEQLAPAANKELLFKMEQVGPCEGINDNFHRSLGHGHRETLLRDETIDHEFPLAKLVRSFFSRCRVFHFHDTSLLSPMRRDCPIDDNRSLAPDAANLPAMLYLYRKRYPSAYRRILAAVKAIAPFFDDFVLEPLRLNPRNIALHWRAKNSDYEFAAHQLSDGTLRAIALFTLLLQPEEDLPELIVLDEPELGLHPAALAVLSELLKSTAQHSQLLIATQSAALIDHFEAEDIVTVNLRDGCSTFERLDPVALKSWLEEYKLSELWERNVIGGGPY